MRQNLKSLTKLWYQKLKDSDFKDIESGPYLKEWDSHYFHKRYSPITFSQKRDYFSLAEQFLSSHSFETEIEKEIWFLHSEGKSYRQIASHLRPAFRSAISIKELKINKDNVNMIISRLRKVMLDAFKASDSTGE